MNFWGLGSAAMAMAGQSGVKSEREEEVVGASTFEDLELEEEELT